MKKRISPIALICALVIIFQSFSYTSFAEDLTGEKQPLETAEYALFEALSMLPGEVSFDEGNPMQRKDYAYVVARMMGYNGEKCEESRFADVESGDYYAGAVMYLLNRNIIFGDGGFFRPNDGIIYDEATVIAIRALGYYQYANLKYGGYPNCVSLMASHLDLYSGIGKINYADTVKTEDAFAFLKNVSQAPVLSGTLYGDDYVKYEENDEKTLLKLYRNISFDTAKMTDNGITALNGKSKCGIKNVIIGDKQLRISDDLTDIGDFIGETVDFWYNDSEELVYAQRNADKTSVLEIPYDSLRTEDSDYSITKIIYDTKGNRKKEAKLALLANMIYNGSAYPYFTADDLKLKSGTLLLIDDNNDNMFDTVKITEYKDCIAKSVIPSEKQIVSEQGAEFLDDYEHSVVIDKDGNNADISAITSNSPVAIAKSRGTDKLFIKIVDLSAKTVTGTVDGMKTSGSEPKLNINEKEYSLSSALDGAIASGTKEMPSVGENYTFYINMDGEIFDYSKSLASNEWYNGYMVAIGQKKSAMEERLIVRIIMTDRTVIDVFFREKFNLNGSMISSEDALTNQNLFRYSGVKRLTKRQPIRFKLDQYEEIFDFETPKDITGEAYEYDLDVFSLDKKFEAAQYKAENIKAVNGMFLITPDTMIIQDPYLYADDDVADAKRVLYLKRDDLGATDGLENVQIYDMDEYMCIGTLVFESFPGENGTAFDESMCVIDSVYKAFNSDNDIVSMIDCGAYGAYHTYEAYDDSISFEGLEQGDVIQTKFREGKIYEWKLIFSLKEPGEAKYVYNPQGVVNTRQSIIYGPLLSVNTSGFVVGGPSEADESSGIVWNMIGNSFNNNNTRVVVYDARAKTVKAGSPSSMYSNIVPDARGNYVVEDKTTRVLVRRRWAYAAEVIFVIY